MYAFPISVTKEFPSLFHPRVLDLSNRSSARSLQPDASSLVQSGHRLLEAGAVDDRRRPLIGDSPLRDERTLLPLP